MERLKDLLVNGYKLYGVSSTKIKEGEHLGKYEAYLSRITDRNKKMNVSDCERVYLNEDAVIILKSWMWKQY